MIVFAYSNILLLVQQQQRGLWRILSPSLSFSLLSFLRSLSLVRGTDRQNEKTEKEKQAMGRPLHFAPTGRESSVHASPRPKDQQTPFSRAAGEKLLDSRSHSVCLFTYNLCVSASRFFFFSFSVQRERERLESPPTIGFCLEKTFRASESLRLQSRVCVCPHFLSRRVIVKGKANACVLSSSLLRDKTRRQRSLRARNQ